MESDEINYERPEKENEEPVDDSDQNAEENTESAIYQTPPKNLGKKRVITEDKRLDRAFKILETTSQTI